MRHVSSVFLTLFSFFFIFFCRAFFTAWAPLHFLSPRHPSPLQILPDCVLDGSIEQSERTEMAWVRAGMAEDNRREMREVGRKQGCRKRSHMQHFTPLVQFCGAVAIDDHHTAVQSQAQAGFVLKYRQCLLIASKENAYSC